MKLSYKERLDQAIHTGLFVCNSIIRAWMDGMVKNCNDFYTDSDANQVDNPRFLRKDLRKIQKLQRRLSRKQKGSHNRAKARNRLVRGHLKVSRRNLFPSMAVFAILYHTHPLNKIRHFRAAID